MMTLNYLVVGLIVLVMIVLAFFAIYSSRRKNALQEAMALLSAFDDLHSQANLLELYLDIRDLMIRYVIKPHEVGYASHRKIHESAYNALRARLNKAKQELKEAEDAYEDRALQGNILPLNKPLGRLKKCTDQVLDLEGDLKELVTFHESSIQADSEQGLKTAMN